MSGADGAKGPEPVTCPLCGFTCQSPPGGPEDRPRTASCPLGSGCDITTCPHCGYSLAPRSRLADLLRRLLKGAEDDRA